VAYTKNSLFLVLISVLWKNTELLIHKSGGIEDSGPKNIESELGSIPVAITAVSCD
jgi:hypothetical protein